MSLICILIPFGCSSRPTASVKRKERRQQEAYSLDLLEVVVVLISFQMAHYSTHGELARDVDID